MTFETDAPTRPETAERTPALFGRRRTDDRADLRVLAEVERYWRSLVGLRQVPMRRDVDPAQLGSALPHVMIVERVAPGMARVRLCGQGVNDMMGLDAQGMPLSILVAPHSRTLLAEKIEAMFAGPAIVEVPLRMARGWGRRPITGRLLLLPLADAKRLVTRALGVLITEATVPTGAAARFDVQADGAFRCTYLPKPRRADEAVTTAAPERRQNRIRPVTKAETAARSWRVTAPLRMIDGGKAQVDSDDTARSEPRPKLQIIVSNDM